MAEVIDFRRAAASRGRARTVGIERGRERLALELRRQHEAALLQALRLGKRLLELEDRACQN